MALNTVEACLSATADFFEEALKDDPALADAFLKLLEAKQTPFIFRLLDNVLPAGYMVTIKVEPQPK